MENGTELIDSSTPFPPWTNTKTPTHPKKNTVTLTLALIYCKAIQPLYRSEGTQPQTFENNITLINTTS